MTNAEKFKTAEERHKAYEIHCESLRSLNIAILHDKFEWLELEYGVALLTCPFCGGNARIIDLTDHEIKSYQIRCSDCMCKTESRVSLHSAVNAWNRRVK